MDLGKCINYLSDPTCRHQGRYVTDAVQVQCGVINTAGEQSMEYVLDRGNWTKKCCSVFSVRLFS